MMISLNLRLQRMYSATAQARWSWFCSRLLCCWLFWNTDSWPKPLIISVSLRWTSWHGFIGCMGLQNLCYCLLRDCICRSCHCSRLAVSIIGKTDDRNITNLQTISLCDAPISDSRVGEMAEMHSGATGQFREEEEEGCCQTNPANWHFFIVKIITFSRVLDFHVARQ